MTEFTILRVWIIILNKYIFLQLSADITFRLVQHEHFDLLLTTHLKSNTDMNKFHKYEIIKLHFLNLKRF